MIRIYLYGGMAMIITVTMNPAIDKTVWVEQLKKGGLNRISHPVSDAGGKGINVSKTIQALGGRTIATGFLGKNGGEKIITCLEQEQISHDFVMVEGTVRTNLKIMEQDGTLTELNEQGMTVPEEKEKELIKKLTDYAGTDTIFVLAGSIPDGVTADIYAQITKAVKAKGAKVFVDADGALFQNSLQAIPSMLKPNHVELAEYFNWNGELSEKQLVLFGKELLKKGVERLAISRGKEGAIFLKGDQVVFCPGLKVEVRSAVGAGDAMVAALSYAADSGMNWEDSIRLSMAASAGAVTTVGTKPPQRMLVEQFMKQVILKSEISTL